MMGPAMGRTSRPLSAAWVLAVLATACSDDAPRTETPRQPDAATDDSGGGGERDAATATDAGRGAVDAGGTSASPGQPGADDAATPGQPASPLADCGEWPPVEPAYPLVATCVGFEGGVPPEGVAEMTTTPDGTETLKVDFRGEVIAIGSRPPPGKAYCFDYELNRDGSLFVGMMPVHAAWLWLENEAGARVIIGVIAPNFGWRLLVGTSVVVTNQSRKAELGVGDNSALEVRTDGGQLVAWFGSDTTVEQLAAPSEFQFQLGEQECLGNASCFPRWARQGLQVQVAGEDAPSPLAYGQRATFGDYVVVHAGVDIALAPSRCGVTQLDRAAASLWLTPF